MLKFLSRGENRTLVGLGLTNENLRRMQEGLPVHLKLSEMGLEGPQGEIEFFVYHGKNEESLKRELEKGGLIGPETEEHIDPRLGL